MYYYYCIGINRNVWTWRPYWRACSIILEANSNEPNKLTNSGLCSIKNLLSRELTLIYFSQSFQCRHCICVVMPIALHTFLNEDILKCIEKTVLQVCIIGNTCSMKQANSLIIIIIFKVQFIYSTRQRNKKEILLLKNRREIV